MTNPRKLTESIPSYVGGLRHEANCWGTDTHQSKVLHEAADHIEALQGELEEVEKKRKRLASYSSSLKFCLMEESGLDAALTMERLARKITNLEEQLREQP